MIMSEEFVKIKTLEMLQEKGFNEYHYPTQAIAHRWLREVKNLYVCIYNCACGYGYEISKADNGTHIVASCDYKGPNDGGEWDTYEEALEAGIQRALELI